LNEVHVKKIVWMTLLSSLALMAGSDEGEKLFKSYCWGCHHQTAEAFGPSFKTIAAKRNKGEIIAQIVDPKGTYKSLGYRRNSMPAFDDLNATQLDALADYILTFKENR